MAARRKPWSAIDAAPSRATQRVPRVRGYDELHGAASARFGLAPVDLSVLRICLEHRHLMHPLGRYLLDLP